MFDQRNTPMAGNFVVLYLRGYVQIVILPIALVTPLVPCAPPDRSLERHSMQSFGWLHIADLHRGTPSGKCLWPNVEQRLLEDLKQVHEWSGPWHVIFFSGDLVYSGNADEYKKLNDSLARLYHHIRLLGSNPFLLSVPGNHDLARPNPNQPEVKLLSDWILKPEVQEAFWTNGRSPYRKVINRAFRNYMEWDSRHLFPRPTEYHRGLLPGDFGASIHAEGLDIGIVGLNTSFLQLSQGDFQTKLAVHPRQLEAAVGEDYAEWCSSHDICMLMTHHPVGWLTREASASLNADIAPPGRFYAHLCGHLHTNATTLVSTGGAQPKRTWQCASLFGLEQYQSNEGWVNRRHGYTAGSICASKDTLTCKLWPRSATLHQQGHWHIVDDTSVTLEEHATRPETIPLVRRAIATPAKPRFKVVVFSTEPDLATARRSVAGHLESALGVEVKESSGETEVGIAAYDLAILLQGWWWDNGKAARAWQSVPAVRRYAFLVSENSDWPPRRLAERLAENEIRSFRTVASPLTQFDDPAMLPEMVGMVVTNILQQCAGAEVVGLLAWERAYLDFRLPAWKAGRTAGSKAHLLESENAEELYQPDLYLPLDGVSPQWRRGPRGEPRRVTRQGKGARAKIGEADGTNRVRLARWLGVPAIKRLAIIGAPGGGKTIFLTRIAAALANACLGRPVNLEPELDLDALRKQTGTLPIPIVLEATRITKRLPLQVSSLVEAIKDEVTACGRVSPDSSIVEEGLRTGRYIILIDALDEIPDYANRAAILHLLKGLAAENVFPQLRTVVTSRSARYTGDVALGPELEIVSVAPLNEEQVAEFGGKWARHRQRDDEYKTLLMAAVSGLAEQVGGTADDQAITENPLMLTAICMVFERFRSLPDDRGRLCDLLIGDLCASRHSEDTGRGWKLDVNAKKDLLQRLALAMQEEGQQTWPISRAIEIVIKTVPTNDELRLERARRYLDWTADHTGLLRFQASPRGEEEIRFWHRLFREYLAAHCLAQQDKTARNLIEMLWEENRLTNPFWEDVMRLLPRTLGTIEKAKSLRERLLELADASMPHRGRLMGLAVAAIIENRDLFPDVDFAKMALQMAQVFDGSGEAWSLPDKLLFLEGLGRLDPVGFDPRLQNERWVHISAGEAALDAVGPPEDQLVRAQQGRVGHVVKVPAFDIAWAPVTVQEYSYFLREAEAKMLDGLAIHTVHPMDLQTDGTPLRTRIRQQLRHPNRPVTNLTFAEATGFCQWRTKKRQDGRVVRPMTFLEWRRAAFDGDQRDYPWGNAPLAEGRDAQANWGKANAGHPTPPGAYCAGLCGAVDLVGNVWQWAAGPAGDSVPKGRGHRTDVVCIPMAVGGCYGSPPAHKATIAPESSSFCHPTLGFRCVLEGPNK